MFRVSCFPISYLVFSVSIVDSGHVVAMLSQSSFFQRANVKASLIVRYFDEGLQERSLTCMFTVQLQNQVFMMYFEAASRGCTNF